MFKFGTLKAFNARNNPRTKAVSVLKNGHVVILDEAAKTATIPADATAAKGKDLYVVNNIVDKPEIRNSTDFEIAIGEYVRGFYLADLVDLPVEFDSTIVTGTYSSIAVGDKLVAEAATGKWVEADPATYHIYLLIVEKTTFGNGSGFYAVVKTNDLIV